MRFVAGEALKARLGKAHKLPFFIFVIFYNNKKIWFSRVSNFLNFMCSATLSCATLYIYKAINFH